MTFFWGRNDALSNWYRSHFRVGRQVFSSGEQWLMYAKATLFKDAMTAQRILDQHDPRALKALGQTVRNFIQAVWDANCEEVAFTGLVEKFRQNKALGALLISTADTVLVEASPYDRIWGIGIAASDPRSIDPSQWLGTNRLGKVLTRARDDLAERARQVLATALPATPATPPVSPLSTLPFPTPIVAQHRFFQQAINRSANMTTPNNAFASLASLSRNRSAGPAMEQPTATATAAESAPGALGPDLPATEADPAAVAAITAITTNGAAEPRPADALLESGATSVAGAVHDTPSSSAAATALGAGSRLFSEPLKSVAVVVDHSDRRIAQILTGVVGQIIDNKFTVDPAYSEISYLFTLATDGEVDVDSAHFQSVPMLEGDVAAFRANMIRGSSAAWDALYASVGSGVVAPTDIGARMLAAERAKVRTNVDRYLAAQNLASFDVPIVAHATVPQPAGMDLGDPTFRATDADFIKEARVHGESIQINAMREVLPTPSEPLASPPLSAELRGHAGGFDLTIDSAIQVLANDPDQAMRVMMNVMAVVNRNTPLMRNVLTYSASSIQNASMVPYEAYEAGDDEDESDDWRDRGG